MCGRCGDMFSDPTQLVTHCQKVHKVKGQGQVTAANATDLVSSGSHGDKVTDLTCSVPVGAQQVEGQGHNSPVTIIDVDSSGGSHGDTDTEITSLSTSVRAPISQT